MARYLRKYQTELYPHIEEDIAARASKLAYYSKEIIGRVYEEYLQTFTAVTPVMPTNFLPILT